MRRIVGEPSCKEGFPHTPSKKSLTTFANETRCKQMDSRRERIARFCCRERLGTTKTPSAKRVVLK